MRTRALAAPLALAVTLVLAACSSFGGAQTETSSPTVTPSAPPSFVPGGTAEQNHAWFDQINQQTLAADGKASAREFVDALVAGGFDKGAMQVTHDRTTVDLEADYIIVSIKIGDACLIGQRTARGYASEVAAVLSTGKCLVGETLPINW